MNIRLEQSLQEVARLKNTIDAIVEMLEQHQGEQLTQELIELIKKQTK